MAFGLILAATAAAAAAVDSEGELAERGRLIGNLGVAHADIGVYPDRAEVNPVPELSGGTTSISVPEGAEIVQTLVYWAGRGQDWADPNIVINGQSVDADVDYRWETPIFDQSTYAADITATGIIGAGDTTLNVTGADQGGERFYGVGFLVVFEDSSQPEVEVHLLEGNEFAFFNINFADDIGQAGLHSTVNCTQYSPSIEARELLTFSRIMGVDAGRSDGPPRSQRIQWWTGTEPVATPVVDGVVQIPSLQPQGSVDNPITPRVASTSSWGSDTYEGSAVLNPGDTHHCAQVQSVNIDDGAGASLSQTNQGGAAQAVYRLGNLIWFDTDDDGMAEIGEPGIDGVTIELLRDGEDEPLATTESGDDGSYEFEGILCGNYRVQIPSGQGGWTIDGESIDPAVLAPSAMTNPNANDDSDNDNNGVAEDGAIVSGVVQIGDCGEDGDFADDASNEPTDEVDRKTGPDADPDDDAFEDVRSNASVDIGLTGPAVCDTDGNVVVDGEEGVNGASAANCGDDPIEVCDASGTVVDGPEGVNGASAANCGDDEGVSDVAEAVCNEDGVVVVTDADGNETVTDTVCNEDEDNGVTAAVCNEDGVIVITTADGTEEATATTCDAPAPVEVCDASGTVVDGPEGVNGASAANCGDDEGVSDVAEAVCNEDGVVVVTDADGNETVTDTVCNEDEDNGVTAAVCNEDGVIVITTADGTEEATATTCDAPAPAEVCDADGNVVTDGEEGVNGASAANCGDEEDPVTVEVGGAVECPAGSDRAGEVIDAGESCDNADEPPAATAVVCDADGNEVAGGEEGVNGATATNCDDEDPVTVEVGGVVEEQQEGVLAITGVTSQIAVLVGLIAATLGMWFFVASAWFRPAGRRP